jgi:hypothetical protein
VAESETTQKDTETAPTMNSETSAPRDAVIFLPGLAAEWGDRRLDETALRIAAAFDRNAATPAARFSVKLAVEEEEYAAGCTTRRCTILRTDGAVTTPVLDLYAFYYQSALREQFERRNLFLKALLVLAAIVIHVPKVILALLPGGVRAKSRRATVQILQALGIMLLLAVYMGTLVWALIQTVMALPELGGNEPSITLPQIVIVVSAMIGTLIPGIGQWIARAAVNYLSLVYYILFGEGRQDIAGRLSALVEHLAEKGPLHPRIHMVAYSFGTIVALDSVFPRGREPVVRLKLLDTLVTVGTPFDAIRSWWPKYFGERHALAGCPRRWLNVYAPSDVLGSNFRNDEARGEATESVHLADGSLGRLPENMVYAVGPALDDVSVVGLVTLVGLRAHALYWEDAPEAESVFGILIPRWYAGTGMLA